MGLKSIWLKRPYICVFYFIALGKRVGRLLHLHLHPLLALLLLRHVVYKCGFIQPPLPWLTIVLNRLELLRLGLDSVGRYSFDLLLEPLIHLVELRGRNFIIVGLCISHLSEGVAGIDVALALLFVSSELLLSFVEVLLILGVFSLFLRFCLADLFGFFNGLFI